MAENDVEMLFVLNTDANHNVEGFIPTPGQSLAAKGAPKVRAIKATVHVLLERSASLELIRQALKNPDLSGRIQAEMPAGSQPSTPLAIYDHLNARYERSDLSEVENHRLWRLRLDIGLPGIPLDPEEFVRGITMVAGLAGYQAIGPIKLERGRFFAALEGCRDGLDDFRGQTAVTVARVLGGRSAVEQVEDALSGKSVGV